MTNRIPSIAENLIFAISGVVARETSIKIDDTTVIVSKSVADKALLYSIELNKKVYNPSVYYMTIKIWSGRVSESNAAKLHIMICENKHNDVHGITIVVIGSESKGSPILYSNTQYEDDGEIKFSEFMDCYLPRILESTIRMVK